MRALAGELSKGAALAGTALWAVAAVLHAGLHIQLHRHAGLAVLEGCGGQQPLTLGSLKIGRQEFSQLFTSLFSTPPPLEHKDPQQRSGFLRAWGPPVVAHMFRTRLRLLYHIRVLTFNLGLVDLLPVPKLNGTDVYA